MKRLIKQCPKAVQERIASCVSITRRMRMFQAVQPDSEDSGHESTPALRRQHDRRLHDDGGRDARQHDGGRRRRPTKPADALVLFIKV